MTDVRDLLARAAAGAGARGAVDDAVVEADLARGRAALARRGRRAVVASVAGVAAVACAIGVLPVVLDRGPATAPVAAAPSPPTGVVVPEEPSGRRLVPYKGPAVGPYVLDVLPEGWSPRLAGDGLMLVGPGSLERVVLDVWITRPGSGPPFTLFAGTFPARTGGTAEQPEVVVDHGTVWVTVVFTDEVGPRWTEAERLRLAGGLQVPY